jgi:hypothetical protein
VEVNAMNKTVSNYQQNLLVKQEENRRNGQLLSMVLKEQIRGKDRENRLEKQEKGWRVF